MQRLELARRGGQLAPILTLASILTATVVAPWFSWPRDALSELGVDPATALLFNGGLILGALVALLYTVPLWQAATTHLARLVSVLFSLTAVTMGLVGVFPMNRPLHFAVAVSFYLLLTATLAVDGLARRGETTGRLSLALAAVHLVSWGLWARGLFPGPGLALPELVGAVILAVWVVGLSPVATESADSRRRHTRAARR
ncbi:hypothetical protein AUR64_10965 [Haloprofundus marisrubri]|uniref:DUF998 domain-containing protein n=1 Tax=Haloprofundus marisrubri TaxID=1514971 RepID=A0A0W1R9J3_9EURY|nr:DUF998 domain-containing protein [Haloprofundus marisrubri]KTG10109.1 hypothetical protein AUR64_10965 [Haloprofundus marisrubri]